jgi:hypothetical protein
MLGASWSARILKRPRATERSHVSHRFAPAANAFPAVVLLFMIFFVTNPAMLAPASASNMAPSLEIQTTLQAQRIEKVKLW